MVEMADIPSVEATPATSVWNKSLPQEIWPLAALVLVLIFNALFTPGFFRVEWRDGHLFGSVIDVLNRGTPVMLLALGMTLVIATGGVDLSVGAVMAISGTVVAAIIARPDYSIVSRLPLGSGLLTVLAAGLAVALVAGLWNGLLVAILEIQPIVATLILMVAGRGVAQLLSDGQIITFAHAPFEFVGSGFFLGLPFPVTIAILMFVFSATFARWTALGLFIECVGNNPRASLCAGINIRAVKLLAYVFCSFCAGVAGLIVTSDIKAADANNAGLYLELDAILAVVIGGTALTGGRFSLTGSMIGAILIQTLSTTILMRGVPPTVTLVVKAAVIVAVCLLQSSRFRRLVRLPEES